MAAVPLLDDGERDRAVAALRRHYVHGRLTLDELSARVELVLQARSRDDLAAAFRALPAWPLLFQDSLPTAARAGLRTAVRTVAALALASTWLVLSVLLVFGFAVAAVVHGPTLAGATAFALVWAGMSAVLWLVWQRTARRP